MREEPTTKRQFIYMDEAGDPGFKLDSGSSSHFILGMCIFEDHHEAAATAQSIIKAAQRLDYKHEFHGKKATASVSTEFFNSIISHHFKTRLIFVDKSTVWSHNYTSDPKYFYRSIAGMFVKNYGSSIVNARLFIDGDIDSRLEMAIKTSVTNLTTVQILDVQFVDSKSHRLIQLVDMVVTAAYKGRVHKNPRWLQHWNQLVCAGLIDDEWWFH